MTEKPVLMRLPSLTSRMERVSALLQQFSQFFAENIDGIQEQQNDIKTIYQDLYDAAHDPRWEIREKIATDLPYTRRSFWDLCASPTTQSQQPNTPHLAALLAQDRTLQVRLAFVQSLRRDWSHILRMYVPEIEASKTLEIEASKTLDGSETLDAGALDGVFWTCLSALGRDHDVRVKRELSAFDNLPPSILQMLLHDEDRTIRYHLCKQMYLSSTMAAFLLSVAPDRLLQHPRFYTWLSTDPNFLRHTPMTPPVFYAALAANLQPSVVWLFAERLLLTADSYLCRVVIAALSSLPQDQSAYDDFLRRHPHIPLVHDQQAALLWIFDDVVCQKSMRHLMAMLRVEVLPAIIIENIINRVDPDAAKLVLEPLTEPLHSLLQHPSCPFAIIGRYIDIAARLPVTSVRYQQLLSTLLHYPHLSSTDLEKLWFCVKSIPDFDVFLDKIQHFLQNPKIPLVTVLDIANTLERFSDTDIYHDDLFSETAYLRRQLCLHPACPSSIHEKWQNDPSPWVRSVVRTGLSQTSSQTSSQIPEQALNQTTSQTQLLDDMLADVLGLLKD